MPGISGIIDGHDRLDKADRTLRTFEEVQVVRGLNYVHRPFRSDHCVILNTLTGILPDTLDQPAIDPAGDTVLFLEGELFNMDEVKGYLDDVRDPSTCGLLLSLFLEHGDDFVSLLNGEFNIVIYQKREKRLAIFNDHIGSRPFYFMEQGNRLLFGSEKKSILAVTEQTPTIDSVGLLQIFAHRHNLDDRTYINGLKRLIPGSRLVYHQGRLSLSRYHILSFNVPNSTTRVDALIDEWSHCLQQATVRRLQNKERVGISLSSGLDSRAVACAIPRDFRPIWSRTWGLPNSPEALQAIEIARRLNFKPFREQPMAVPCSKVIPKIVWRTEGEGHFMYGISLSYHATSKAQGDFMVGGWLGDASSGSHIYPYMLRPHSRQNFIERAYRWNVTYPAAVLRHIFNQDFLDENFPKLRDAFLASFLEGESNIQVYEIWDLYQRQGRMTIGSTPVNSHLFEYIRPFHDKDHLNFVLSLPTHLRFGQSLYQAMIHRLGPEIRDIPNANNGLMLHGLVFRNFLNEISTLGLKARTRLMRKIYPSYLNKLERRPLEDLAQATRQDQGFRQLIEGFVQSNYFDSAIFNRPGIIKLLESHYQGRADHAYLLGYVATFAAVLPYFVYNRTTHCPPEAEPLALNGQDKIQYL